MITTITLNPAIDRTIILDTLKHGAVNRIKSVREDMGGKGINVAKVLSSLGEPVQAIGFMGKHNKNQVEYLLNHQSFLTDFVYVDAPTRINTKLVELELQSTTDLNEPGFKVSDSDLKAMINKSEIYGNNSDYVVLSGSLPQDVPVTIYKDMIERIKSKTKIVLDAEGALLLEGLKAGVDIIKPNIHELEDVVGKILGTDKAVIEVGLDWIQKYKLTYVLVSMGDKGSLLIGEDFIYKALPVKVEVKGTVGAGDSMLAGFVYGLKHYNVETALAYGIACGTLAVSKEGTETFDVSEVEAMMKCVQFERLEII